MELIARCENIGRVKIDRFAAVFLMFLSFVATGCRPRSRAVSTLDDRIGIVVSGYVRNTLALFDAQSCEVRKSVSLPRSWAKSVARDPHGRIWIGLSGGVSASDDRVCVYSPDGAFDRTIRVCDDPGAGVSFAGSMAFVACCGNGMTGRLVVLDIESFRETDAFELALPDGPWTLVSSAVNDRTVVVAGLTSGADDARHCVIALVDIASMTMSEPIRLGVHTDVWRIISHDGKFYLLNAASGETCGRRAADVFEITPTCDRSGSLAERCIVRPLFTAPSPVWGVIDNGVLYSYHNPAWNSTETDPRRCVSVSDLSVGETKVYDLPDGFAASDIGIVGGRIVLAGRGIPSNEGVDGLFEYDTRTSAVRLLLAWEGASSIVPPADRSDSSIVH
jgi:hypothetical protein